MDLEEYLDRKLLLHRAGEAQIEALKELYDRYTVRLLLVEERLTAAERRALRVHIQGACKGGWRRGRAPMGGRDGERYHCPLCGGEVLVMIRPIHAVAEGWLIDRIKEDHPDWIQEDGACPRCIDPYRASLQSP